MFLRNVGELVPDYTSLHHKLVLVFATAVCTPRIKTPLIQNGACPDHTPASLVAAMCKTETRERNSVLEHAEFGVAREPTLSVLSLPTRTVTLPHAAASC
jgi:hypothetical protein